MGRRGRARERETGVTVRRALAGDEANVRSVRLQALADAPEAFDSTYQRELAWTTSDWQRWIAQGATFILEGPDGPKGIAAGVPDWSNPAAVFLLTMWVHPSVRGTGAADRLVTAVVAWAESEGAKGVWLHAGKGNLPARRLYERNGFGATGREVVRKRDGLVEIEMHRALGPAPDDP